MPRIIWKGAITFGLVNIPVVLKPASRSNTLDLDLLDVRDMAPVGYQRINKRTGKPVEKEHIVKGYQYEKDEYVLLNEEDFRQANVEATQTVDIVAFVDAASIPPYYFDTPYFLEPDKRGVRGYTLLLETMRRTGRAALALVVLRNRQHLAAVLVSGKALMLNTMRFAEEVLPMPELELPKSSDRKSGVSAREIEMAVKLVEDMTEDWKPEQYHDTYHDDLMARIEEKIESGKTHVLTSVAEHEEEPAAGAKVIDMVALLKQSLGRRPGHRSQGVETAPDGRTRRAAAPARGAAAAKKAAKPAAARKRAAPASAKTAGTRGTSGSRTTAARRKHA